MGKSHTVMDYHGNVDQDVIELLLQEIKKEKEFVSLDMITRKRVYAILVECLENIYYHSLLKAPDKRELQPHICVSGESDRISITAGNVVSKESKERLSRNLDILNRSDYLTLRTMHENTLDRVMKPGVNGSGLGLIDIAIKSGNQTSYSFTPLADNYLYFELCIFINK